MAIHPIDLSTVYSQMDKVAKYNASQNQAAQYASQVRNDAAATQNLQKSQAVQEAAKEGTDTAAKVRPDGKNADDGTEQQQGSGSRGDEEQPDAPRQWEIKDPRLGNRIDITR